ncbi:helix-turn-helix transcriptional regulator [Marinobacter sp. CA1]|uniref:helix-turn-helix transcriptional regulator n=1 Tax=Marinobacter sp. CA1 TaxID=2817656 RepID=UPI001D08B20E|nr:AraC family transcriptional regulator [Marinobacter sp. CA1]UDL05316.1 AraC family transcriptional regulator [Marinobacter sp. CA1]
MTNKKPEPLLVKNTELSSQTWPAARRWSLWKQRATQFVPYNCDIIAANDYAATPCDFDANIRYYQDRKHGILLSASQFQPNIVQRSQRHLADNYQHLVLICLSGSRAIVEHNFQRRQLRPGDLLLLDMQQEFAFALMNQGKAINCHIPRSKLAPALRNRKDLHLQIINGHQSVGAALRCYLQLLPLTITNIPEAEREHYLLSVAELLNACLTKQPIESRPLAGKRWQIYLECIDENFTDPDFSVDKMAKALQVSSSYVHRLFRQHQTTVRREIKRRRIDYAKRCLQQRHRLQTRELASLTDIALACGFRGLSQFSRAFREQVGMSPRDYSKLGPDFDPRSPNTLGT